MLKLTLKDSDLNHVIPANQSLWQNGEAVAMERFYADLTKKNGGHPEIVRRAHRELQSFLTKAVEAAKQAGVPLDQVVVQAPPIMDIRSWSQYLSASLDNECGGAMLDLWFAQLCHRSHAFEIRNAVYRKDTTWVEGGTEIAFHACGQDKKYPARICCSIGTPWESRMVK